MPQTSRQADSVGKIRKMPKAAVENKLDTGSPHARGTQRQAIGRSRGGLATKAVALVDAPGNLTRFVLLPGQRHDSVGPDPRLNDTDFDALLPDKAFDSNALRKHLVDRGVEAVIPSNASRSEAIPFDAHAYIWRHLVENCFCKLKGFRRIATRYDKPETSFEAMIHLAAGQIALR